MKGRKSPGQGWSLRCPSVALPVAALVALAVTSVTSVRAPIASAQSEAPATERVASAVAEPTSPNTVTAYGEARDHGPAEPLTSNAALTGMAATTTGAGYWLAGEDGGVFTFGDAGFHGSAAPMALIAKVVAIAATPTGDGYWLASEDGGVFSFGDAVFHGSLGGVALNQPIVGVEPTPTGQGYWLVAADGGVFSFGDAAFRGSAGSLDLVAPVVAMASTPSGDGYWLAAADGGVFTFGDATFTGAMAGATLDAPVVDMAAAADGDGYWLAAGNGEVFALGVTEHGTAPESAPDVHQPMTVAIASHPADGYWLLHGAVPVTDVADRGPAVTAIQERLDQLGYWLGPVDGVYGRLTEQAVYAFQKYEGLALDGAVGPATSSALRRASRPAARSHSGDLVEIDKARQLLFVVRDGTTRWIFNTSTGTEEPYVYEGVQYLADTPPGVFSVTRQIDGVRVSNLGRLIRPKYFHPDGIAIHGSSFVPPHPASHGCVRVTLPAIDFLWANGLVPLGSTVWVYGQTPAV